MSQSSSGSDSFFLKTYTVLVSIARPFSPLNNLSGIMALQERNEVNNYEHYKCGEKIWTEIWRISGALYLASSATWLHLHLCWNAITGFGVCLYQYDRCRPSYGMAFGLVVIFISSLNAQKMSNAIFRGKVLWYWGQQKRRMNLMQILIALIGVCAAAMLLWYVYILMKGDDQAWALWFSMFYKQLMNQYDDEQAELEAKISVCYILICWQAESYMNTLPKLILRLVIWRNIW